MLLLDDVFLWLPLRGVLWVVEQVHERAAPGGAEEVAGLRRRLVELRLRYEMDELDEETYRAETSEVTRQLKWFRERQREEVARDDG